MGLVDWPKSLVGQLFLIDQFGRPRSFSDENVKNKMFISVYLFSLMIKTFQNATNLLFGSYIIIELNKSMPSFESQGKVCFKLLYGCFFTENFSKNSSSFMPGHMASVGVPSKLIIKSIWFISLLPGNKGLWSKSSPNMQQQLQISMAVLLIIN